MPFWPEPFWPLVYALVLAGVAGFALARGAGRVRVLAGLMIGNWIMTRAATAWAGEHTAIATAGADLLTMGIMAWWARWWAGRAIAALFLLMLGCYAAHDFGLLEAAQMWAWVDVLAYLQLFILFGGTLDGGHRARSVGRGDVRNAVRRGDAVPVGVERQAGHDQ